MTTVALLLLAWVGLSLVVSGLLSLAIGAGKRAEARRVRL